jgi:hypothetical protein
MRRGAGKAEDRGWGSEGRSAGGRSPAPHWRSHSRERPRRPGRGELSVQHWRLPRGPRRAAQRALPRRAARAIVGSSATASGRPGSRHSCHRRLRTTAEGWGNELTELWSPIRGALDAGSRPPQGCKVVGSARLARSLLTLRFGDWAGSGVVGGGSGQLPPSLLGASEWGPGGGEEDGSWAPPSPAIPPSSPGGGALATGSALWTCPPHPRPSRFPLSGLGRLPDFKACSNWEMGIQL